MRWAFLLARLAMRRSGILARRDRFNTIRKHAWAVVTPKLLKAMRSASEFGSEHHHHHQNQTFS